MLWEERKYKGIDLEQEEAQSGPEQRTLRKTKGTYILLVSVRRTTPLRVGALGKIEFRKGTYAYVGSAQNGIEKRVARHLRREKRKFWHIDYLLVQETVRVEKVLCKRAPKQEEGRIARAISKIGNTVRSIGSSGCSCSSHLFKIEERFLLEIMESWGGRPLTDFENYGTESSFVKLAGIGEREKKEG